MSGADTFALSDIVTVKEISKILKVSTGTIYYWVSRKEIPVHKVGRHNRFIIEDVLKHFGIINNKEV